MQEEVPALATQIEFIRDEFGVTNCVLPELVMSVASVGRLNIAHQIRYIDQRCRAQSLQI
jgi:hypothetical protein